MTNNTEGFAYSKLIKLLGMTRSAQDGEALNAMKLANKELDKLGLTWGEFVMRQITVVADPFASGAIPDPRRSTGFNGSRPPASASAPSRPPGFGASAPPPPPPPPPPPKQPTFIRNQFAGVCVHCNQPVAANAGATYANGTWPSGKTRWAVEHEPDAFGGHRCPPPPSGSAARRKATARPAGLDDI